MYFFCGEQQNHKIIYPFRTISLVARELSLKLRREGKKQRVDKNHFDGEKKQNSTRCWLGVSIFPTNSSFPSIYLHETQEIRNNIYVRLAPHVLHISQVLYGSPPTFALVTLVDPSRYLVASLRRGHLPVMTDIAIEHGL